MNAFLHSLWMERIGWALLHSLWQGALIWSFAALCFVMGRKLSAARRHVLGWLAITLLALCPLVTITWLACKAAPQKAEAAATTPASATVFAPTRGVEKEERVSMPSPVSTQKVVDDYDRAANAPPSYTLRSLFPFLVIGWLIGVALLTLRLTLGWWWLARLRQRSTPVADPWTETFANLRRRFSLPAALVRCVSHLGIPMVVGWLRPVIYLPASLLSGQSAAEVEAVFLHEMAHLKRGDLLTQLWITIVETLLFYHPAVHSLGGVTREMAEEACDDLVLQWTSDGRSYARALVALEEARAEGLALAATGGRLRHRLRRILGMPQETLRPQLALRFGLTSCAGVALYLFLGGVAVPQLAKALTPAERVALIEKKQQEAHIVPPIVDGRKLREDKKHQFVAIGQIHLPLGAKAPALYHIYTFSPHYSAASSERQLKDVHATGHGEEMTVAVQMEGFVPAETPKIYREAVPKQPTFELTLEAGFPALIEVVDEGGKPVAGATLNTQIVLSGGSIPSYGPKTTDHSGRVSPENVTTSSRLDCVVFAHGFQWQQFRALKFSEGKPTVLRLTNAAPVSGDVVDAATQMPVADCRVICVHWNSPRALSSWGFSDAESAPAMSRGTTDASGHVALDVCSPEDSYLALFNAPGYQHEIVKIEAGVRAFRAALKKGLVFEGVIRDPDKLLKAKDGKVSCYLYQRAPSRSGAVFPKVPLEADGLHFRFEQLTPSETSFGCGPGEPVKLKMEGDLKGVEWRITKKGLVRLDGSPVTIDLPKSLAPRRKFRVEFATPPGAPPLNGKVHTTVWHDDESQDREQNVTDGVALVDLAIPGRIRMRPGTLAGWTFNEMDFKIDADNSPEKRIDVIPAGAISGTVINAPPSRSRIPMTGFVVIQGEHVKMPDGKPWTNSDDDGGLRQLKDNRYFTAPLPLQGSYRVVFRSGTSFAESPMLKLDDAHPFLNQNVTFPQGVNLSGHVLYPDGRPCGGTVIRLLYHAGKIDLLETVNSADDGSFELPGVNFEVSGSYVLSVDASPGIPPLAVPLTRGMNDINLQRTRGLPLDVVLVDAADKPVSGARLSAVPKWDQPGLNERDRATSDAPSDNEGRVHFSTLKPGTYFIGVDQGTHEILQHELSAGEMAVAELPVKSSEPLRFRVKKREATKK